jgi:hypothetical protein
VVVMLHYYYRLLQLYLACAVYKFPPVSVSHVNTYATGINRPIVVVLHNRCLFRCAHMLLIVIVCMAAVCGVY